MSEEAGEGEREEELRSEKGREEEERQGNCYKNTIWTNFQRFMFA